jgi:mannose-1-phosphate guanylyltransferase
MIRLGFTSYHHNHQSGSAGTYQLYVNQREDAKWVDVLCEPEGKNTAPAVGLAWPNTGMPEKRGSIGYFPADHHILDTNAFEDSVNRAIMAAQQGCVATLALPQPSGNRLWVYRKNQVGSRFPG